MPKTESSIVQHFWNVLFWRQCILKQLKTVIRSFLWRFKCLNWISLKEGFCTLFFRPRTRPKTSLQCFALGQRESKAKHCRDVLGRVLGRKNKVQNQSLTLFLPAMGGISPYMSVTWPSPVGIGLSQPKQPGCIPPFQKIPLNLVNFRQKWTYFWIPDDRSHVNGQCVK